MEEDTYTYDFSWKETVLGLCRPSVKIPSGQRRHMLTWEKGQAEWILCQTEGMRNRRGWQKLWDLLGTLGSAGYKSTHTELEDAVPFMWGLVNLR
jgi:hypothetical protein